MALHLNGCRNRALCNEDKRDDSGFFDCTSSSEWWSQWGVCEYVALQEAQGSCKIEGDWQIP